MIDKFGSPGAVLKELQKPAQSIANKNYQTGSLVSVKVGDMPVSIKGKVIDRAFRVSTIAKKGLLIMLGQQECLALKLIFCGDDDFSNAINERISKSDSLGYEDTGVGFYSTIKLSLPLEKVPNIRMWEYNFEHPDFPHGGSFMCTVISKGELELEAVTLGGASWPYPADAEKFKELE